MGDRCGAFSHRSFRILPSLCPTDIHAFRNPALNGESTGDNDAAAREQVGFMRDTARRLRAADVDIQGVGTGSIATGLRMAKTGPVTEVRPGICTFGGRMLIRHLHFRRQDDDPAPVLSATGC